MNPKKISLLLFEFNFIFNKNIIISGDVKRITKQ